jgi:hypothetical protein
MTNTGKRVESYQDLRVWQKGMDLVELIYRITKKYPLSEMYGLIGQDAPRSRVGAGKHRLLPTRSAALPPDSAWTPAVPAPTRCPPRRTSGSPSKRT